jgi:hypothetical protein
MKAWGYDTSALENADDIAARDRYARLKAERDSWWVSGRTGGCSEDPPFWLRGTQRPQASVDHSAWPPHRS